MAREALVGGSFVERFGPLSIGDRLVEIDGKRAPNYYPLAAGKLRKVDGSARLKSERSVDKCGSGGC